MCATTAQLAPAGIGELAGHGCASPPPRGRGLGGKQAGVTHPQWSPGCCFADYMAHLVEVQHERGASGGQTFHSLLTASLPPRRGTAPSLSPTSYCPSWTAFGLHGVPWLVPALFGGSYVGPRSSPAFWSQSVAGQTVAGAGRKVLRPHFLFLCRQHGGS